MSDHADVIRDWLALDPRADWEATPDDFAETIAALDALVAERDEALLSLATYKSALSGTQAVRDDYKARAVKAEAERDEARRELDETVEAYHARLREKSAAEREVVIVREMQAEWFINEAKRCRALGMPIACCDEWPECSHVSAWVESHPLAPSATGGDS